jgi:hypothetical protein
MTLCIDAVHYIRSFLKDDNETQGSMDAILRRLETC